MQYTPIPTLRKRLSSPEGSAFLSSLYGAEELEKQRTRYLNALSAFEKRFGEREVLLLSAPGRTELSGNHTDHQHGRVLAASLTVDTLCVAARRDDYHVTLVSQGHRDTILDLEDLTPEAAEQGRSSALVRGMAAGVSPYGIPLSGFDAYTTSAVPSGGGFSSSAAFEVLLGTLFCALAGDSIPPIEIAKLGQRAENVWFGKPCGLMDQCACALGGVTALDFQDPANPKTQSIPFDFGAHGYALCAVSVGSSHADLTADYAAIPGEMGLVAQEFGMKVLRFVEREEFEARLPELEKKLPQRAILRAKHFFDENERVPRMVEALQRGDVESYRREMLASGESSRYQLQNIIPDGKSDELALAHALDRSAELLGDRGAWRVHGGGFGGSMQALMPVELFEDYRKGMDALCGAGATQLLRVRSRGAVIFE